MHAMHIKLMATRYESGPYRPESAGPRADYLSLAWPRVRDRRVDFTTSYQPVVGLEILVFGDLLPLRLPALSHHG
jgi:hypothetical protein